MISTRIKKIASFLEKNDRVVDVGCDHGYLGIYAIKNKLISNIILSDISKNALNQAIKNIEEEKLDIKTYVSDGLKDIPMKDLNTIVISGMGTKNILEILEDSKLTNINKLILQSNNNLDELREKINKKGFELIDEITLKENNIYYCICLFKKGNKQINKRTKLYGIPKDDKIPYYEYLLNQLNEIYSKIPKKNIKKRFDIKYKTHLLNKSLKESRTI